MKKEITLKIIKNEYDEYEILYFEDGIKNEEFTYYTDSLEDAKQTEKAIKNGVKFSPTLNNGRKQPIPINTKMVKAKKIDLSKMPEMDQYKINNMNTDNLSADEKKLVAKAIKNYSEIWLCASCDTLISSFRLEETLNMLYFSFNDKSDGTHIETKQY